MSGAQAGITGMKFEFVDQGGSGVNGTLQRRFGDLSFRLLVVRFPMGIGSRDSEVVLTMVAKIK